MHHDDKEHITPKHYASLKGLVMILIVTKSSILDI